MMPDDFFLQSHTPKGTLWPIAPRIGVRLRCSYLAQKVVQNEKTQHFHCEAPTMTSTLSEPQMTNCVGTRTSTEKAPVKTCEE